MKKIILSLLCLGISINLLAQKTLPEIKVGTTMTASAFVQGQEFPLIMTVKSLTAPVILAWSVDGYGDGTFEISEKGMQNGTALFVGQPGTGATKLSDIETYSLISKAAFKTLTDTKGFTYNGMKFKVKASDSTPMKFGGKEADVVQVISEDNKVQLWILNNPNLPFIVQTAGLPIDILVNDIK
ncbi:hypothetical protein [Pedobacter boryungensis]|uniref:Uncharacterized protein n=1 Tax=Pedobacter boryungensis TaxID=869962 RepID=A0ABX2D7P3_9SPHI|nr:hypothetical protein [Pedobacter boryungensis]NQX30092.1 hypothetical protein [Pedobacter boryungensis]